VLGERELAIGFRLIGLSDVFEVDSQNAVPEFQRVLGSGEFNLLVASESIRPRLTEAQRTVVDSSINPLVIFVPTPTGEYEIESISALAKRILGVSLVPAG